MIDTIYLSQKAKDQLVTLKRKTKIPTWNIICRWGFCVSLAESTVPPEAAIPVDSNLEMTWRTFGGLHSDIYWGLLRQRCHQDGLGTDEETLAKQFRLHLHRGIAYLYANKSNSNVSELLRTVRSEVVQEGTEHG